MMTVEIVKRMKVKKIDCQTLTCGSATVVDLGFWWGGAQAGEGFLSFTVPSLSFCILPTISQPLLPPFFLAFSVPFLYFPFTCEGLWQDGKFPQWHLWQIPWLHCHFCEILSPGDRSLMTTDSPKHPQRREGVVGSSSRSTSSMLCIVPVI